MVEAHSAYEAEVETQMESTFGVSSEVITSTETAIQGNVETLFTALTDIGGVLDGAVETAVNACGSFYTDAQATAETSFESSVDSDAAETAAKALVLVKAQGHAS